MAWQYIVCATFTINVTVYALKAQDLVRFKFAQFSHGVQEAGGVQDASGIQDAVYNVACGQCLSACSTRKNCALVSYRRLIQQCRLVSKDEKDQLPVTTDQTGSILVDKENIDITSEIKGVPPQCERCGDDQTCDKTTGTCKTVECPKPQLVNFRIYGNVRTVGSRLIFSCDAGYMPATGDAADTFKSVTCQENGMWSSSPICVHNGCSQPPAIPNTFTPTQTDRSQATYTCDVTNDYYDLGGRTEVAAECDITTGIWTNPDIECVKDCPDPPEIVNTDRWLTANTPGSNTTYRCLYGTQVEFEALCQGADGTWTGLQDCSTDDVCDEYLVEQIPDSSLTASSYYADNIHHAAHNARLVWKGIGGWVAKPNDYHPYIQALFGGLKHVVGIVTMGRALDDTIQLVSSFTVSYSRAHRDNCDKYFVHQEGVIKIFQGNTDLTSKKTNYLPEPLSARCVRLHPKTWVMHPALRFDVIGCDDRCSTYLVSRDYGVSDASLTATSFYVNDNGKSAGPEQARLYNVDTPTHYGGWGVPNLGDEYIQVRFRRPQTVSSIVTKGMNKMPVWVTQYHVTYSSLSDCSMTSDATYFSSVNQVFSGNTDSDTRVTRVLSQPINAVCVRIYPHPAGPATDIPFPAHIGLRFDLKGCIDYVCPESPERFITPSIDSSLALRLMTGSFDKAEAESACVEAGGKLVILGNGVKERKVLNMIKGCSMYNGHVFWVDGELRESRFWFSDGTSRDATVGGIPREDTAHPCLAIDEKAEFPVGTRDCSSKMGYICEYITEQVPNIALRMSSRLRK